jgi:superfamily I DNA and/or RNA helicase
LVLSFYTHQVALLKFLLEGVPDVRVSTVDGVIGGQAKRVVLSPVCTKTAGFCSDIRRVNVAISRCQEELYVVGHRQFWRTQSDVAPALAKLANLPASDDEL